MEQSKSPLFHSSWHGWHTSLICIWNIRDIFGIQSTCMEMFILLVCTWTTIPNYSSVLKLFLKIMILSTCLPTYTLGVGLHKTTGFTASDLRNYCSKTISYSVILTSIGMHKQFAWRQHSIHGIKGTLMLACCFIVYKLIQECCQRVLCYSLEATSRDA